MRSNSLSLETLLKIVVLVAMLPSAGSASNGVLEINQACAAVGCFPGDPPGFPVTIARGQPGSYLLTSSLVNLTDADTIRIRDDHVTLDLNGFAVSGPGLCTGIGAGISCTPFTGWSGILGSEPGRQLTGIVVKNGVVRGAGGVGILLSGSNHRVEGVHVVGNVTGGIALGRGSAVERSRVVRNGAFGIGLFDGAVRGSLVVGNGSTGITTSASTRISANVVRENANVPVGGESILVEDNAVTNNGTNAILLSGGGYARNVFRGNGGGSEVVGGTEIGPNLCGNDTTCP